MASKFDQFLKASWNAIFSTKKRRESRHSPAAPQIAAEDRVHTGLLGEDLGGGRQTFKLQDGLMSGTWLWKGLEGQEDLVF